MCTPGSVHLPGARLQEKTRLLPGRPYRIGSGSFAEVCGPRPAACSPLAWGTLKGKLKGESARQVRLRADARQRQQAYFRSLNENKLFILPHDFLRRGFG